MVQVMPCTMVIWLGTFLLRLSVYVHVNMAVISAQLSRTGVSKPVEL